MFTSWRRTSVVSIISIFTMFCVGLNIGADEAKPPLGESPKAQNEKPKTEASKAKITDTSLGKTEGMIPDTLTISPDARHLAFVVQEKKQYCVVKDGVQGKKFDQIASGTLLFRADSSHVAYLAKQGAGWLAVVDGVGTSVGLYLELYGIGRTFQTSGSYCAVVSCGGVIYRIRVEITEPPKPADAAQPPAGLKLKVSSTVLVQKGDFTYVVTDHVSTGVAVSPDTERIAYVAPVKKRLPQGPELIEGFVVVAGNVKGSPYEWLHGLVFSPNSKRYAYAAHKVGGGEDRWVVVVDNEVVGKGEYKGIALPGPIFSPDSKRVAYVATRGKKEVVVIDGVEFGEYDAVANLAFSPDSKRIAYMAKRKEKWVVVVEKAEGKQEYDGLAHGGLVFSPDSKRLACVATVGGKELAVVDDIGGKGYDLASRPVFGPDSKHVAYVAGRGAKVMMVMDDIEGKEYDTFPGSPVFDSPGKVHGVAIRDNEAFLVEMDITEAGAAAPGDAPAAGRANAAKVDALLAEALANMRKAVECKRFADASASPDEAARFKQAADVYLKAARDKSHEAYVLMPDSALANKSVAMAEQAIGNYEKAIEFAERAIKLDPANDDSYTVLGAAHAQKGLDAKDPAVKKQEYQAAIDAFQTFIKKRPEHPSVASLKVTIAALQEEIAKIK